MKPTLVARVRENAGLLLVLKMAFLGVVLLLFLIPLFLVRSLIEERAGYRRTAEDEVISLWGGEQTVGGPLLVVPYLVRQKGEGGKIVESTAQAFFLPETLEVTVQAAPEKRRRGIFEVTLYSAEVHVEGSFRRPELTANAGAAGFAGWRIRPEDVLWGEAQLAVELPALRGLTEQVALSWTAGGRTEEVRFQAGTAPLGLFGPSAEGGGIRAPLPEARAGGRFALDLLLKGGRSLGFLPLGEDTRVRLSSPWPSPRFSGAFLPATRSVGEEGFEAEWHVISLGRGYPQAWRAGEVGPEVVTASRFGVDLMVPADAYRKVLRSVKYGILFVLLPFLVFFLFEAFSGRRVHALQFLLVGFAECLFYLLLLSVSEHLGFEFTYLLAALATVALVSFYAGFVLGDRRRGLLLAPVLGASYAFLYAALQSQDYALLIGSLGLFAILAGVMEVLADVEHDLHAGGDNRRDAQDPPLQTGFAQALAEDDNQSGQCSQECYRRAMIQAEGLQEERGGGIHGSV
jgi:inner membrane protein